MKKVVRCMVSGLLAGAGVLAAHGAESWFFRLRSFAPIEITGFAGGVIAWEGQAGVDVTVETSGTLTDPQSWRRYTGVPGSMSHGSVRVYDRDIPPAMVLIPGGTNAGTDPDYGAYSLTVDPFYMDATPVTKSQWDAVYNWATHEDRWIHVYFFDNAGSGKEPDHPVHTINWYDAMKWCNARSEMEDRTPVYTVYGTVYRSGRANPDVNALANGYRMPTVEEHEYASRGGLEGKRFPWGDRISHDHANYKASGYESYCDSSRDSATEGYHPKYASGAWPYTSPVRSFTANGYGLYDMAGNVWEWCWDSSGSNRHLRGGSWYNVAEYSRGRYIDSSDPDVQTHTFGFRAVCR